MTLVPRSGTSLIEPAIEIAKNSLFSAPGVKLLTPEVLLISNNSMEKCVEQEFLGSL
jgi:hypothetical protein